MGLLSKFHLKKHRVVLLGLDGTPDHLISRLASEGVLPNVNKLLSGGHLFRMEASIPEISSVSWTCFMTGVNPAKHGIFGFTDLKPNSYEMYFPNSQHRKAATIWEILQKQNRKSIIINLPSTYPATPIDGILISGFVAVDLKKSVQPLDLLPTLEKFNYRIDVNTTKAKDNPDFLFNDLDDTLSKRREVALHLFKEYPWDFFMLVITGTDRLHHFMWSALDDKNHAYHKKFLDYYSKVDELIGEFHQMLDDQTTFMMMSDHGFTALKQQVYLNYWLQEKKWFQLSKSDSHSLEDIGVGTKAFNMDPARIYIHQKYRYPRGEVETGKDYQETKKLIFNAVENIRDPDTNASGATAENIIGKRFFKEEIYSGLYFDQAPDILLVPKPGYDLKGSVGKKVLMDKGHFTGMHSQDDAFFYIEGKAEQREKVSIYDVLPTILERMKLSLPTDLDGKSL